MTLRARAPGLTGDASWGPLPGGGVCLTARGLCVCRGHREAHLLLVFYCFQAYASQEVILSGGAINSPQLLMLSGVGNADDLKKLGLPVVCHLPGELRVRLC